MIAFVQGEVVFKEQQALIVRVGGVGLRVFVPAWLSEQTALGQEATLHTSLVVREQELSLYGFSAPADRDLFVTLLGVSGVGPRVGLSILSSLSPETIQRAVFNDQPELLARVPGIGKKTAQKIIFHLKDRLRPLETLEQLGQVDATDEAVLDALVALGYSLVEAQAALQSLPPDAPPTVEDRLRLALQHFSSP